MRIPVRPGQNQAPDEVDARNLDMEETPVGGTEPTPPGPPEPETEWKNRYARLAADFDNYKKRILREEEVMRRREQARIIVHWLDVLDTTERALNQTSERSGPWYEGFAAIHRQMLQVLDKQGVKRLNTDGQPFDPRFHEAIAVVPAPGQLKGIIVQTDRTGYAFEDGEILRPARVVVAQ